MDHAAGITLRPARAGDGAALFEVTRRSVLGLAGSHYSAAQLAGWMGDRDAAFYEGVIAQGGAVVAEKAGSIVGFVDAEAGEVTRLFLLPETAGAGLGKRLLQIGIVTARAGHSGPIKVEATRNAESFYRHHGFATVRTGHFSHGVGGDPIEIVLMELPTKPA
ncbi:GNAT family N-acetyltransferase [Labrys neptuniae]